VAPFSKLTRFYTDRLPGEAAAANALAESGLDVVTCSEVMT
jgi:DeoR family glycerol-3-phosphate regulon repressor